MRRHPIIAGCAIVTFLALILLVVATVIWGPGDKSGFFSGGKVAVVEIKGVIFESREILKELHEHRRNDSIRAIVVRIDSPGGAVGPSQEIYATLKEIDVEKPVVVSMGAVAASGGYYIALGSRKIVANPGTITGSIGVIIEISNIEGLMKWAKIRQEIIKSGPYKDIGSPFRSLTNDERDKLQAFVDDIFNQFVDAVATNRKLEKEEVLKLADGMIYSGRQALDLGLIDKLGALDDAIRIAAQEAGIEGEPSVVYPSEKGKWKQLLEGEIPALKGIIPWEGIRVMYLLRL